MWALYYRKVNADVPKTDWSKQTSDVNAKKKESWILETNVKSTLFLESSIVSSLPHPIKLLVSLIKSCLYPPPVVSVQPLSSLGGGKG